MYRKRNIIIFERLSIYIPTEGVLIVQIYLLKTFIMKNYVILKNLNINSATN